MSTTALIDADYLVYRLGFGRKEYPLEEQIVALEETIYGILEPLQADFNLFYLSDSTENNFRTKFYPEYKKGRFNRPEFYEELRQYLIDSWCAEVTYGMEADDALSLENVNNEQHRSILVSIDKDLLQVPGCHYNPVKQQFTDVSPTAALFNLYFQLLVGDATDNIKGCPKIGVKKAEKLLEGCFSEEDYYNVVRKAFSNDDAMVLNARLVWLLSNDRTFMVLEKHGV